MLNYRLNLHESINDYLIETDLNDVNYYYRVKTAESILDKIKRYADKADQYTVNNLLNDIFGCRIILSAEAVVGVLDLVDAWQEQYGLKNWYMRDKDGYKGVHIYFKNGSNFYFPWELQIWVTADVESNIESHRRHKRNFV
jgi:ppGpp synthetase/RelA/SpoT-type nucleotidyltranferase